MVAMETAVFEKRNGLFCLDFHAFNNAISAKSQDVTAMMDLRHSYICSKKDGRVAMATYLLLKLLAMETEKA